MRRRFDSPFGYFSDWIWVIGLLGLTSLNWMIWGQMVSHHNQITQQVNEVRHLTEAVRKSEEMWNLKHPTKSWYQFWK
jgi:hypothetical protein